MVCKRSKSSTGDALPAWRGEAWSGTPELLPGRLWAPISSEPGSGIPPNHGCSAANQGHGALPSPSPALTGQ